MQLTNQQLKEKISAFIETNTESFVKDLGEVISFRSVKGEKSADNAPFGDGVRGALDKMLDISRRMGIESRDLDGYIGFAELGGESDEYLATIAHLDVVPEGEGWDSPPYTMQQKDGWLIGRGVEDNKGPCVMQLYIAKFFKELGIPLRYSMRFIFGTNEETGMLDIPYYLKQNKQPLFCFTPDADFPLSYGEKGVYSGDFVSGVLGGNIIDFSAGIASNVVPDRATCLVKTDATKLSSTANITISEENGMARINAIGIGGHAAHPDGTVNAIGLIIDYLLNNNLCAAKELDFTLLLQKLHSVTDGNGLGIACRDEIFDPLTCVGGMIKMQDGRLVQNINSRLPTAITAIEVTKRLSALAAKCGADFKAASEDNAFHVDPNSPEMQALLQVYNEVTGQDAKPFTMGGGTYARKFKNAAAFGPCFQGEEKPDFIGTVHGANEGISIETVKKSMEIYILALWRLQQLEF